MWIFAARGWPRELHSRRRREDIREHSREQVDAMIRNGRLRDAKSIAGLLYYMRYGARSRGRAEMVPTWSSHMSAEKTEGNHLHFGWTGMNYNTAGVCEIILLFFDARQKINYFAFCVFIAGACSIGFRPRKCSAE